MKKRKIVNLVVRKTALCGKIDKENSTVTMVDSIKHAWAYLSAGVRGCESFSWLRQPRYGCRYEPLNVFPLLWYPVVKLPRVKEPRVDTLGDVWFEFRCDVDHLKKTRRKELVFIYSGKIRGGPRMRRRTLKSQSVHDDCATTGSTWLGCDRSAASQANSAT